METREIHVKFIEIQHVSELLRVLRSQRPQGRLLLEGAAQLELMDSYRALAMAEDHQALVVRKLTYS